MSKYAEGTTVSVRKSREEIAHILERFGATNRQWTLNDDGDALTISFDYHGHNYRFTVRRPTPIEFLFTPKGQQRAEDQIKRERDAETKRRFRSLANFIKALIDATNTGIVQAEEALMPFKVLPSGETAYQKLQGRIRRCNHQ